MTKNINSIYFIPSKRFLTTTISIESNPDSPELRQNFALVQNSPENSDFVFKAITDSLKDFSLKLYIASNFKEELKNDIKKIVFEDCYKVEEKCTFARKIYALCITISVLFSVQIGISVSAEDNSISMFVF